MNGESRPLFKLEPALVNKLKEFFEVHWKAIASLVLGACDWKYYSYLTYCLDFLSGV
jgi:hypothetical protein